MGLGSEKLTSRSKPLAMQIKTPAKITPVELYQIAVETDGSLRPSILRYTNIRAAKIEPRRANTTPHRSSSGVIGNKSTRTPTNPNKTDVKRLNPTRSFAITIERAVMKIGIVIKSAVARLISILEIAKNHVIRPIKPKPVLKTKPLMFFIFRKSAPLV